MTALSTKAGRRAAELLGVPFAPAEWRETIAAIEREAVADLRASLAAEVDVDRLAAALYEVSSSAAFYGPGMENAPGSHQAETRKYAAEVRDAYVRLISGDTDARER